jgi:hypothetical protein
MIFPPYGHDPEVAMNVPTVVIALGLLAMVGCVATPDDSSPTSSLPPDTDIAVDPIDGVWCGDAAHEASPKVYVNIRYATNGEPSASPDSCEVKRGTRVTWRGPQASPAVFELDFPGGPPAHHADLESDLMRGEREKVTLVASADPGTYKYGIAANGKHVDPDLKIKPN